MLQFNLEEVELLSHQVMRILNRLGGIETKLVKLDGRVNLLTWMVGGVYGVLNILGAPALWLLLHVPAKVRALG